MIKNKKNLKTISKFQCILIFALDHGCWMFINKENTNAKVVRKWMGDFSTIKCIGKLAARLGQSLSTSIATFEVKTIDFEIIPDIKVGNYNFTDGIGIN